MITMMMIMIVLLLAVVVVVMVRLIVRFTILVGLIYVKNNRASVQVVSLACN